jgi:hypothetical protein
MNKNKSYRKEGVKEQNLPVAKASVYGNDP